MHQAPLLRRRRAPAHRPTAASNGTDDSQVTECEMPAVQYKPFLGPAHAKYTTTIDEVPEFLRDTYILSGYRHLTYSYRMCFHSLTYLHNETGNVLTHFFALVFFIGLIISTNYNLLPQGLSPGRSSWGDYVVFYGYLLSACGSCF
ncbi:inc metabolism membrane protein [Linderina macrospora]|uniref:Inc metabolism membrane protein n=1 Tax=Linderina macrospora TaxID=4868 RepID=A0ACC1IXD5_9FUNG|nr:inc metabolism membrane protein [Linderina macrospora]